MYKDEFWLLENGIYTCNGKYASVENSSAIASKISNDAW